jgi:hypothetical protein
VIREGVPSGEHIGRPKIITIAQPDADAIFLPIVLCDMKVGTTK